MSIYDTPHDVDMSEVFGRLGGTRSVSAPRFKRGQRVKLRAELGGKFAEVVDGYGVGLWQVRVGAYNFVVSDHALEKHAPMWLPGDVVVVRFESNPVDSFTYVRGAVDWPGDRRPAKSDAFMDRLYLMGRLEPVLQAGGVPFDGGRL